MKQILQVKLRDGGLKGITVTHLQVGARKNIKFKEKHKVDYDAPVNNELEAHFDGLQQNLIDLCSLSADANTQDVRVTEARISPDGEFFQLIGTVRSVGERDVKMTSPRINNDQSYSHWGEAMAKVKALFVEAKSYITEKKVMNPAQMVLSFCSEKDMVRASYRTITFYSPKAGQASRRSCRASRPCRSSARPARRS